MKRYIFIKKRESIPVIKQGIVTRQNAGGIKLEYDIHVTDNIHMKIGKRDTYIPYWKYNKQRLVFFKPLKAQWDFAKYPLAKNFQGKKDDLMTNLWLILMSIKGNTDCYDDIINIKKDFKSIRIKTLCTKQTHHEMIKHLNNKEERFPIPLVQIFY